MKTSELYREAEDADIPIISLAIPETVSICIQTSERCYIGIDYHAIRDEADHRVHLAHEIGHCKMGAFYNRWAARDVRQKYEHRADKWAIQKIVPESELDDAVADGYTSLYALAEHFGVTEEFMRKVVCWYTHGNLATELYF